MISNFVYGYIMGWISCALGVITALLSIYWMAKYKMKRKGFAIESLEKKEHEG